MQKYYFTALNQEDKPLQGALEASSEAQARLILGDAGLAVLDLEIYNPEKHSPELGQLYEFSGKNDSGKLIRGTLIAEDDFSAYVRLRKDYGLKVESLYQASIPAAERIDESELLASFELRFTSENSHLEKKKGDEVLLQKVLESQKKEQDLLKNLSIPLDDLKDALKEMDPFLNLELKRGLQDKFDQWERIKHSNNLEHLRTTLQELLGVLQSKELFLSSSEIDPDLQEIYEKGFQNFKKSVETFKNIFQSFLPETLGALLAKAPEKISKSLNLLERVQAFLKTIYLTFFVFMIFFVLFLVFSGILSLFGGAFFVEAFEALFFSFPAWYIFGGCVLSFFFWGIDFEYPWKSLWQKYVLDTFIFLVLWGIYTVNSPVLYFWTY